MSSIRLDKHIVEYIRKVHRLDKYGGQSISSIVGESIDYFLNKDSNCYACEYHKDSVAGLELGRQSKAFRDMAASSTPIKADDGDWVVCTPEKLKRIQALAKYYGRSTKLLVEQAVLEHLTRPSQCSKCPFYKNMTDKIEVENKE